MERPSIFYIVLDAYARQDILKELYQYDNSEFLSFLEGSGFQVASNSRTNYSLTLPSLASSLNYQYLDDLSKKMGESSRDTRPLTQMIKRSKIRSILSGYGYKFYAFSSAYRDTEIEDADVYLKSQSSFTALTGTERLVLKNNLLGVLFRSRIVEAEMAGHRETITYTLDQLSSLTPGDNPVFAFAHLMTPHPPFVFSKVNFQSNYLFADGSSLHHRKKELVAAYKRAYVEQLMAVNELIKRCVTAIKRNAKGQIIIIIQSDHGPRSGTQWDNPSATDLKECTSILNAIYFPNRRTRLLHDSISPVNTFRVVLKEFFRREIDLLDDRTYLVPGLHEPYKFIPVVSHEGR